MDDIVRLDNACTNNDYRSQLLEKISGVILKGDRERFLHKSLFEWLGLRRIYLININLAYVFNKSTTYTIQNNDDLY